jgi:RND family efflux transporter MFP subunit
MRGKIIATVVVVVALGLIVMTLLNNKAKSNAKAEGSELSTVLPVTVSTVEKSKLDEDLSLVGTVQANRDVTVVSETTGRIRSVRVSIGDRVNVGTVLVNVDDELKQAGLLSAQANYDKAKSDFDRNESLWKEKAITDTQFDGIRFTLKAAEAQMITARRQLKDTRVTSPIAGQVSARPAEVGLQLNPGTAVATIVDISTLKVRVNVAEADVFKMHVGDKVQITTDVYPGVKFQATINNISAKGDEAHTYPVEITLPNSSKYPLRAGMFARTAFTTVKREEVVAIPREALVGSVKDAHVYTVENGSKAHLRNITVGNEANGKLAILQGLQAGETIVVNGQNNLKDGASVNVVK